MRQTFAGSNIADFPPASDTAVAATVTRTNLWNPALWTPIGAFEMKPGVGYILRCGGVFGTNVTPGTLTFNPTFGASSTPASNIALGASVAVTPTGSLTAQPWWAEFVFGVRSLGQAAAGATLTGNGYVVLSGAAAATSQVVAMGSTVVTTADHTVASGVCLDVTWSSNAAGNTITAQWHNLQSLT